MNIIRALFNLAVVISSPIWAPILGLGFFFFDERAKPYRRGDAWMI